MDITKEIQDLKTDIGNLQDPLLIKVIILFLKNKDRLMNDPLLGRKVELIQFVMNCEDVETIKEIESIMKQE